MKILTKGLILVGIPLIFGIVFISSLSWGISQANRLVLSELMVKDSIISFVTAARCSVCAIRYGAVYNSTHDENWHERAKFNDKLASAADAHLKTLCKRDPSLPVPSLQVEQSESVLFAPGSGFARHLAELGRIVLGEHQVNLSGIAESTRPLQDICDERAEGASNATWSLRATLYVGIFLEFVISIALTIFFCVSITNILKKILNNTINLSKGLDLTPPVKGGDEIAELDRFLFHVAEQLRELERFKKETIGVVAQELKNPLYQVETFLVAVRDGVYGILNPKSLGRIAGSLTSIHRLIALIGDLFLLDRTELQTAPKLVPVQELTAASVDAVKELAEKSGISLAVKSNGGSVVADRDRLVQVMVNLLSNAMKFTPANGQIVIETQSTDEWLECRIIDQGPGIPESFRREIFEPYKQVDEKDAIAKKGTGLGLTISKTIVEQHGGTIGVDSVEGNGSTFWFKVPSAGPSLSETLRAKRESNLKKIKIPRMRFSVLKQGLLIISVPLLFQLVFVCMLAGMLDSINKHNAMEEISQKLLMSVNQSGDDLLEATRFAMVYMYTKTPINWQLFQDQLAKSGAEIDKAKELVANRPDQVKDLQVCHDALARYPAKVQKESARLAQVYAHDSSGSFATMSEFMDLIKYPDHPPEELLHKIHALVKDKVHLQAYEPFFDAQDAMERLISRENFTGEKLAAQRERLMNLLNLTLLAGIGFVSVLSLLLANFLMRNLISRVNHVMENTSRIVKREPLEFPKGGGDEIAYLDQIVCETGNRLIALEQFKQSLIAIVSHEIRTPLTAVCITLELLSGGVLGELSADGTAKLQVVDEEANDLKRLINDMLDLEKISAGKFVLDKIEFPIGDLVKYTSQDVTPLAQSKNVLLKHDSSVNDVILLGDRERLRHALVNLVSSRIKCSPERSTVIFLTTCNPSEVEFRVIDHNHDGGIPEELRDKIFDRFVQVENPGVRDLTGPALTLVITKAIVELHGGKIGVESEMGTGSTFWVKLPLGAQAGVLRSPA
jgi:signal transduction histidine kinase